MKNYLKGFNELFQVNEMASTLSKLGLPKKLINVIHSLPDKIENITPFTFNRGVQRSYDLPPIGQNRPSHEVGIVDHFRMKKTELLGDNYGSGGAKLKGWLADQANVPWGDTRILLAVPNPGKRWAGKPGRYDYIYHKGSAWGDVAAGKGKKYRVLTMDEKGRILRDWQAYQGKLTYPKDPKKPDEPRKFRNDFSDFPTDAKGFIDVYILDPETVSTEPVTQKLGDTKIKPGDTYNKPVHNVPVGKARSLARTRRKARLVNSDTFIEDFAARFKEIIAKLFGKRKQQAAAAYANLILQDDADPSEINRLNRLINTNQDVMNNISRLYTDYLAYLKGAGDYANSQLDEFGDMVHMGSSVNNLGKHASILDVVDKHGKDKALRNFAEYIISNKVDDIYKEERVELEDEPMSQEDKFKNLLDVDFDLANPFDDEDIELD